MNEVECYEFPPLKDELTCNWYQSITFDTNVSALWAWWSRRFSSFVIRLWPKPNREDRNRSFCVNCWLIFSISFIRNGTFNWDKTRPLKTTNCTKTGVRKGDYNTKSTHNITCRLCLIQDLYAFILRFLISPFRNSADYNLKSLIFFKSYSFFCYGFTYFF